MRRVIILAAVCAVGFWTSGCNEPKASNSSESVAPPPPPGGVDPSKSLPTGKKQPK